MQEGPQVKKCLIVIQFLTTYVITLQTSYRPKVTLAPVFSILVPDPFLLSCSCDFSKIYLLINCIVSTFTKFSLLFSARIFTISLYIHLGATVSVESCVACPTGKSTGTYNIVYLIISLGIGSQFHNVFFNLNYLG